MPIDENGDEYEVVTEGIYHTGKIKGDPVEPIGKMKEIVDRIKNVLKDKEIQCINRGEKFIDKEKYYDIIFVVDQDNEWIATIIGDKIQDSVFPF